MKLSRYVLGFAVSSMLVSCATSPEPTSPKPTSREPASPEQSDSGKKTVPAAAPSEATPSARSPEEHPLPFQIVDAMPSFWTFWERAEGLKPPAAFEHFKETMLADHPQLYTPGVLGIADAEGALSERFVVWFETLPPKIEEMRAVHERFPEQLREASRRFMKAIPEFAWDGTVYLMASLSSFNGGGRMVDGERALLFGLDEIRAIGSMKSPSVLVAHELFHIHQRMPTEPSMAAAMWMEGLAVYASQVLNPGTCLDEVLPEGHLHDPDDPQLTAPERAVSFANDMDAYERELAAELLASFDTVDEDVYAAFFLGRAAPQLGERPVRSGYYFGYLGARDLGEGRSLHELSQLDIPSVEPELRKTLARISEEGASPEPCAVDD